MAPLCSHIVPLRQDGLALKIEQWTADGLHVERLLALADNLLIARAAYVEAARRYPAAIITLRHRIRVIEKHQPA